MAHQLKIFSVVIASLLFYLSGFAALVYEILWMKELSLLFGNSTQAAAATLAAFFAGIAAGNAYWGRFASKLARPLMVYGVLELCITLSAVLYFTLYLAYDSVYPFLFSTFESAPVIFTFTKFILALLLFFPAAFFMGGTLPVMTQYLVRNKQTLGKRASVLYAINTFGAASGALAAGFYLPQTIGINNSYLLAMSVTLLVGLVAFVLGYRQRPSQPEPKDNKSLNVESVKTDNNKRFVLIALAGLSGFASLALQVLWVRMFAQVLHNSVYTYSAILSVFLIALALGSAFSRELARREITADWFLPLQLTLTSVLIASSPLLFYLMTDGGLYITGKEDFASYLLQIFLLVAVVIGVPTIMMGVLLPYLFKLSEQGQASPGETVGRLVTINTVGAILGSVTAGFLMLELIGLWSSIKMIAMLYIIMALWLVMTRSSNVIAIKLVPLTGVLLLFTVLDTRELPLVKINESKGEVLLKVWEGADATVAVVERDGQIRTKLNNWYTLGGTGDMITQQMQTHLPMLLHPKPKSVFYLGLGTGITAGTSLNYDVDEVVVAELAPSVIRASEAFFVKHTNGLYDDPRVTVIAEDGRNVLRGSQRHFDLIISDLFIPWKAGTGTLYSVEHYSTAKQRLNQGGLYTQWLPLYQLTQGEFEIIARSMLEVFPMVSVWRGNFWGDKAVIALVGHNNASALSVNSPIITSSRVALNGQSDRVPLMAHYAGSLTANDKRIASAQLNTDSWPVIEYLAPVNHRLEKAGQVEWFLGQQVLEFIGPSLTARALRNNAYLSDINPAWYNVVQAGYYLQTSFVLKDQKNEESVAAKANYQVLLDEAKATLK